MATTMELIAKNVLGSNTTSVTFSSIPGTFTDLLILASIRTTSTGYVDELVRLRFNGDSGNNYTRRVLFGDGSGTGSFSSASADAMGIALGATASTTANTFASSEIVVPNYANTTTNKSASSTSVNETNATLAAMYAGAGLWSSTAAIDSVTILSNTMVTGSSFYLYGISRA